MRLTAELKSRIKTPEQIVAKWQRDFERFHELNDRAVRGGLLPAERREWIKLRRLRRGVR